MLTIWDHILFFIRSATVEKINSYSFDGEAILTLGDGIVGKIFHYINGKFDFHQRVYMISNFTKNIDGFYFYKCFSNNFYDRIKSLTAKSTVDSVRMVMISDMEIPIPPYAEQKAIAKVLFDVDALIDSLKQLIQKKQNIKIATMQQLLTGKKRLLGFPGEWQHKLLGELCTEVNDGTHYTPRYVKNGIAFYSVENVVANDFTNTKFITIKEHKKLIKRCKPEKGNVLLTRIGTIGSTKFINWNIDASIYVSLALLKVNQTVNAKYIYCYTKCIKFKQDLEIRSLINATPQKINMGDIKKIPIYCPPSKQEQKSIAAILTDMDMEIELLQQRLQKTEYLKSGIMQELLSGRTRLGYNAP